MTNSRDKIPSIAVIIPAFNVEKYIAAAIESVLNQTIKFDELIVIDDGSTDRTLEVIQSIDYDIPVQIITQENEGQGPARNKGINRAQTDYVYFFDSDDLLVNNASESMKKLIRQHDFPDLFLFSGASFKDTDCRNLKFSTSYSRAFTGYYSDLNSLFEKINKTEDLHCSPCLYVSKRKILVDNNIVFNKFFHEDEEFFYKLILSAGTFLVSSLQLFKRRIRANSTMTMQKTDRHAIGQRENLNTLHKLLHDWKNNSTISYSIRKRISRFSLRYYHTSIITKTKLDKALLCKSVLIFNPSIVILKLIYIKLRSIIFSR